MAIEYSRAHERARRELQAGLDMLTLTGVEARSASADAAEHKPHRAYTIGLEDLAGGAGLERARFIGWRFLVEAGADRVGIEVSADEADEDHEFTAIDRGPFVDGTDRAVRDLAASELARAASYEVAVITVPALYIHAIWLRARQGGDDLIVPIEPTHDALRAGRQYRAPDFLRRLRAPATERLAFDDSPRRGEPD